MLQFTKLRNSWLKGIKILFFTLIVYFFYVQLSKINYSDFLEVNIVNINYFVFAVFLVFLNWGLEWLKWFIIVRKNVDDPKLYKVFKSLMTGISTGLVTPNRIGNFVGRSLLFLPKQRIQLIYGTLYGNLSQFLPSITFGFVGLYFVGNAILNDLLYSIISWPSLFFVAFSILVYFLLPFVPLRKFPFLKKYENSTSLLQTTLKAYLFPFLFLSTLRYFVFVMQFTLFLLAFGAPYSHELTYGIYLIYLLSALTPNLILGKFMIRESLALFVLAPFIHNPAIVLVSSLTLWFINLGVPSLIGLFYLMKFKSK